MNLSSLVAGSRKFLLVEITMIGSSRTTYPLVATEFAILIKSIDMIDIGIVSFFSLDILAFST